MRLHKKLETAGSIATEEAPIPKPKKKKGKKLIVFLVVVVILGVAVSLVRQKLMASKQKTGSKYTEETVQRRDIIESLSSSGTLEPADSYTVTSLTEGEILTAGFEEGDTVSKDDMLYTIDSSDASTSLTKAENALEQAQKSYQRAQENLADLNVKSTAAGKVVDLAVEVGDDVSAGETIATVRDSSNMKVELYFPTDEAQAFYVGEAASVTLDGSFETVSGKVTQISGADEVLSGNRIVRKVTIEVGNPGAITDATQATATVGSSACAQAGTFQYKADKTVTASVSGTVASIPVSEGQTVSKNQTLAVLTSDTLEDALDNAADSVEDAQLSLDNQSDVLDNYTISSPIDGTVIDKEYKQGDSYESGETLCIIYDLSYLKFTMNIDELDIGSVEEGQKVTITADAVEGKSFEGTITKVSINGTTTNGVTSYPVTVRIDDTDDLLPGMNIDATIVVSESDDVLAVPVEAVTRGNKILVKTDSASAQAGGEETTGMETGGGETVRGETGGGQEKAAASTSGADADIPEGYAYVEVTLGNSDEDYIEVTSGLNEGDEIAYIKQTATDTDSMTGFMMGEGEQGGAPRGEGGGQYGGGQSGGSSGTQGGGPGGGY